MLFAEPAGSRILHAKTRLAADWQRNSADRFGLAESAHRRAFLIDKIARSAIWGQGSALASGGLRKTPDTHRASSIERLPCPRRHGRPPCHGPSARSLPPGRARGHAPESDPGGQGSAGIQGSRERRGCAEQDAMGEDGRGIEDLVGCPRPDRIDPMPKQFEPTGAAVAFDHNTTLVVALELSGKS